MQSEALSLLCPPPTGRSLQDKLKQKAPSHPPLKSLRLVSVCLCLLIFQSQGQMLPSPWILSDTLTSGWLITPGFYFFNFVALRNVYFLCETLLTWKCPMGRRLSLLSPPSPMIKKGNVNKTLVKESMKEWMNEWETSTLPPVAWGTTGSSAHRRKQTAPPPPPLLRNHLNNNSFLKI